jgi:hypothetical protein
MLILCIDKFLELFMPVNLAIWLAFFAHIFKGQNQKLMGDTKMYFSELRESHLTRGHLNIQESGTQQNIMTQR